MFSPKNLLFHSFTSTRIENCICQRLGFLMLQCIYYYIAKALFTKVKRSHFDIWNTPPNHNAWFTFSLRQHEMRWEQDCEGYIRLVCHILDLFLSRLEAHRNMPVNHTRVKGRKCLASLFKLHSCLVALAQECECLHLCVPHLVHISPKSQVPSTRV